MTRRSSTRRPARRHPVRRAVLVAALAASALGGWLLWPFWQLSGQFGTQPLKQPSRLYGRPVVLRPGDAGTPASLARELEALRYRRPGADGRLVPGTYRVRGRTVEAALRRFPTPQGIGGGSHLAVTYEGASVAAVTLDGRTVPAASLDPPLVTSYYGADQKERRPVGIDDLPEDLILAVLAAEDAGFLEHSGISFSGILRAAWVNLREHGVHQGGSTLTQQLVKNLYLSNERTLARKVQEALLALLLEGRYDKRAILQAYLNEIYWGRSGRVNLMGVGAAAWAYFGKEPSQLTLAESALLAGMIQSPASYSPLHHPQAARARRDYVLERLAQLGWIEPDVAEAASREPAAAIDAPLAFRQAPYFADAMQREAGERFGVTDLADGGYTLLSTLDPSAQGSAEEAVGWGVEALETGWEKGARHATPLEAALVSLDPRDGGILAYVGGRDYATSQFDRLALADRQAGSAFKPVVYAAAYDARIATPASFLEDAPFTVRLANLTWSPQNSDGAYHGWVTTRAALERSLNVPTARLAMKVGLDRIAELAGRMGLPGSLDPFPALALGAMEVSPLELATVYATLAAGGNRPPVHGLVAVFDRTGAARRGRPLPPPERVLDEDVAFLVTEVLQGVLDRGTAAVVRKWGVDDPLAGKTGTTNDRRDSWFAGYSPERVSLVWVGYDDNSPTHLSGTRAALPVWARFVHRVRPAGGFAPFDRPPGVVSRWIDPDTGGLATTRCGTIVEELFLADSAPTGLCPEHDGWRAMPIEQPGEIELEAEHPFKRWLRMIRGGARKRHSS